MIKQTLYFGNPCNLRLKQKQLSIQLLKADDTEITTRPIEDIGLVIMDHPQITISHQAIIALQQNKALIISCDDKHMPFGVMYPLDANVEQTKRQRIQLAASLPLKKNLWQQTVEAKVYNQMMVLEHLGQPIQRLEHIYQRVKSGDPENKEGQAAAYYWSQYLEGFIRDRYGEAPNSLLNYGYAIIRAMVARSLVSSGLNLCIGLHHHNKYNAYCLADDIMEPYRPFVDLVVHDLYMNHNLESFLDRESKQALLSVCQVDAMFGKLRRPLMVGMAFTTASLFQCFDNQKRKIIYPKMML